MQQDDGRPVGGASLAKSDVENGRLNAALRHDMKTSCTRRAFQTLHMDRAFGHRHRGFLDGFGARRMRVAGARKIFGRAAEFHQHRRLVDHLAGFAADDVNAEHAIGLGIGENFHETISGLIDLRAAVGSERKLANVVGDAGLFQFFFGFAERSDFRRRIDHTRNHIVIHMAPLAQR